MRVETRSIDDLDAWQRFDEFGKCRTPHAVASGRGNDDRELQRFRSFGQGHHVMLELAGRIITNAGHEADLMIDEDERRVFRGERRVGADLIRH